mgnify:FL=1
MTLSRRQLLKNMGVVGVGAVLAACAPSAAPSAPASSAGESAAAPATAATDLTIWFHWGGATGERAAEFINQFNESMGADENIKVTIETVPGGEYRQKLTASRLAGTAADVYHTSIPILELVSNEIVRELSDEESAYVRE